LMNTKTLKAGICYMQIPKIALPSPICVVI
jgi:hypothetical protein